MPPILEVNRLSKAFHMRILGDKRIAALEDISFSMHEGEIVGLTGKSGSGKSSLMKCLYRTYLATSGEIVYRSETYGQINLVAATEHQILRIRRSEMTYCSQFLHVIPRVPALEVVAESLTVKGAPMDEATQEAAVFLERLGLPRELWDAFPSTFSGGEQQRINVARSIIAKPRFLLIDEPTASLDLRAKNVVIDAILDLKARGTSVVLITHDAHTLSRLADRELKLVEGRIVEAATA